MDSRTASCRSGKMSSSSEIPNRETRTVTRNGTTYQQDTANIGRKPEILPMAARANVRAKKGKAKRKGGVKGGDGGSGPLLFPQGVGRTNFQSLSGEVRAGVRTRERTHSGPYVPVNSPTFRVLLSVLYLSVSC